MYFMKLTLSFQPSDPPMDFDSDDEDYEEQDYWWRERCVMFHQYPSLVEIFLKNIHSFPPVVAGKPNVISKSDQSLVGQKTWYLYLQLL